MNKISTNFALINYCLTLKRFSHASQIENMFFEYQSVTR